MSEREGIEMRGFCEKPPFGRREVELSGNVLQEFL